MQAVGLEDVKAWCLRRLPVVRWLPIYNWKENLIPDTVSGMMLAIQQVTQGMVNSLQIDLLESGHVQLGLSFPRSLHPLSCLILS